VRKQELKIKSKSWETSSFENKYSNIIKLHC
jgi:hypothetical protein